MKSLQYKLVNLLLLTSTLPLVIVGTITVVFLSRIAVYEARHRITNNLALAMSVYESARQNLKYVTRDQNRRVSTLIMEDQFDLLRNEYAKVVEQNKLDFFVITDEGGTVIVSMRDPSLEGYNFSRDLLIRRAMRNQVSVGTEIMPEPELAKFGLFKKAKIEGTAPAQGLIIRTTQPLINTNEIIIGTITAGYLLNNNPGFIINKITEGTDLVASIFLGDIRIASNVPGGPNAAVLGSRLPESVSKRILKDKETYIGRLKVADRLYLAGYAPILDIQDNPIGILGIGIPDKNVFGLRDRLMYFFILAVILSIMLSLVFGLWSGGHIVRSVRKLRDGIAAFGKGDLNHRIIDIHSGDEIEGLADFFNQTMLQLQLTRNELEQCSRKVTHLTDEVSRSSAQLAEVHKQLLEYERMAAMGRMATVINHELRNIFAEIQACIAPLKAGIDKNMPEAQQGAEDIEKGLAYANDVLNNVLRLSYPKRLMLIDLEINVLISELLKNQALRDSLKENRIKLVTRVEPGMPSVQADGMQMREVLSILVTNAAQAMPDGGTLTIWARKEKESIIISVTDTGSGIPANVLENLFTPFFTTKHRGLGLGLCISKEIVKAHHGTLDVETQEGKGSTFSIRLPVRRADNK
jgi:signal transduction histidine kinase